MSFNPEFEDIGHSVPVTQNCLYRWIEGQLSGTVLQPLLMFFLAALFQVPKHMLSQMKVRDLDELFQPLENDEFLP